MVKTSKGTIMTKEEVRICTRRKVPGSGVFLIGMPSKVIL